MVDYPDWATRELLMNAICHRDYTSNGPIQFYQYDDRIEIMNHGGLYGRANVDNFPNVNDYRNIVVAEAMKVLGFVNRHSRGVLKVQADLKANENGEAIYDFAYHQQQNCNDFSAFLLFCYPMADLLLENGQKPSEKQPNLSVSEDKNGHKNGHEDDQKQSNMTENDEGNSQKGSDLTFFEEKESQKGQD